MDASKTVFVGKNNAIISVDRNLTFNGDAEGYAGCYNVEKKTWYREAKGLSANMKIILWTAYREILFVLQMNLTAFAFIFFYSFSCFMATSEWWI